MKSFKKVFFEKRRPIFNYFLTVFMICGFVIFSIGPVSCRMTEEGIEIQPGDKTCPVVESFNLTGSGSFSVSCSEKIFVSSASVNRLDSENLDDEISVLSVDYDESGKTAEITLDGSTQVGENYVFSAVITDTSGNSTEFEQEFVGFNENPAVLIFSEIRTKSDAKNNKSDFIEFYCLKGGNTHGLKLCSGAKGTDSDYIFPAIEVQAGEYITLHNRTFDSENAINETESDFALSKADESCDTARDLWRNGTDAKIGVSADVLVLKNYSNETVCDGIAYCKSTSEKWGSNLQAKYAELLFSEGIWTSGSDTSSAFKSDSATTVYRSISRKNVSELSEKYASGEIGKISGCADDWKLTEKSGSGKSIVSGATPGFENSTNYFSE